MRNGTNRKHPVPWQDITPAKSALKPIKKTSPRQRLTLFAYAVKKTLNPVSLWKKFFKLSWQKKLLIILAVLLFVVLLVILLSSANDNKTVTDDGTNPVPQLEKGTPNYQTVLPQGKTIDSLGGWTRVSPPGSDPVYTYVDKIDNVQIRISEQPLPDSFKDDEAQELEKFAQSEKATEKITVDGNTVYIGTSSNGPQSLFLIKNKLLILIKSDSPISQNKWIQYINSLQ